MKKTTKLAGLAAGLLALVGVTFTSCDLGDTFGKDYFLGTWETYDYVNGEIIPTYQGKGESAGKNYRVIWKFNGNAENLNDGGIFRQVLFNYGTNTPNSEEIKNGSFVPTPVNYWFGKYDLKANSSYDKGKYYMYYQINVNITELISKGIYAEDGELKSGATDREITNKKIDDIITVLDTWNQAKFINYAYGNDKGLENLKTDEVLKQRSESVLGNFYTKNNINICIRYDEANKNLICSDVEYFRYRLEDADATGFTRMVVTSVDKDGSTIIGKTFNQWKDGNEKLTLDGNKVDDNCSWTGINTRYLGKISRHPENLNDPKWLCNNKKTNADLFKLTDTSDDFAYAFDESEK